jgi:hypothetical protein
VGDVTGVDDVVVEVGDFAVVTFEDFGVVTFGALSGLASVVVFGALGVFDVDAFADDDAFGPFGAACRGASARPRAIEVLAAILRRRISEPPAARDCYVVARHLDGPAGCKPLAFNAL